jgi:maleylpyruvate isomerase
MLGAPTDTRRREPHGGTLPTMTGFADDPDLDQITHQTDLLLETIHTLSDVAVREPSLCTGWTRGHVLTHLARNADGLRNVLLTAANGGDGAFYESQAARNADIDAGSGRSAAELEADVETSADRLLEAFAETPAEALDVRVPRLRVTDVPGEQASIAAGQTSAMRLREVLIHHVDLDAGFTFADFPESWLVNELRRATRRFTDGPSVLLDAGAAGHWHYGPSDGEGNDAGDAGDLVTVSGSPAALFGWVTGRTAGADLESGTGTLPVLGDWG